MPIIFSLQTFLLKHVLTQITEYRWTGGNRGAHKLLYVPCLLIYEGMNWYSVLFLLNRILEVTLFRLLHIPFLR